MKNTEKKEGKFNGPLGIIPPHASLFFPPSLFLSTFIALSFSLSPSRLFVISRGFAVFKRYRRRTSQSVLQLVSMKCSCLSLKLETTQVEIHMSVITERL